MDFSSILSTIDDWAWGPVTIILIIAGGLWLSVRTGFVQFRKLPLALKLIFSKEDGDGEVSSFGALCTALAATVGTGNIVGVATAIGLGGPGALFWMIVAAAIGMATKYSEGLLAIKYRVFDKDGKALGGPFYYIENGMGKKFTWLAKLFAFFGVFVGLMGIGTVSQVNGISNAVVNFFDKNRDNLISLPVIGNVSVYILITATIVAVLAALVIIGGIKRISKVSEFVVPMMAGVYILLCLILLICNITKIGDAIITIIESAFNPKAITGGAVGSIFVVIQKGVARGIFSNEAGLGSAPIAAAAAKTKEPVRQGLISMTGTFIDTIIICTMTGLSIVITGAWQVDGLEGVAVTDYAFCAGLPFPSRLVSLLLMLCLVFFAFTTILGWDYYSESCLRYLTGSNKIAVKVFRILYIVFVFAGPFMSVSSVWILSDIFNALMAIPNMIALFALSGVVAKETKDYFFLRNKS